MIHTKYHPNHMGHQRLKLCYTIETKHAILEISITPITNKPVIKINISN